MKDPSVSEKNAASLVQEGETPIRDISDTALWAAIYRAGESERSDALFKDDLAQRLAGQRGKQIADALPEATRHSWVIVVRTYLVDRYILEAVRRGVDMVINLAAGLDTRPYRMQLPPTLQWIEVDLPWLLAYKEASLLAGTHQPRPVPSRGPAGAVQGTRRESPAGGHCDRRPTGVPDRGRCC